MPVTITYDPLTNKTCAEIEGGKDFAKNLNKFMDMINTEK